MATRTRKSTKPKGKRMEVPRTPPPDEIPDEIRKKKWGRLGVDTDNDLVNNTFGIIVEAAFVRPATLRRGDITLSTSGNTITLTPTTGKYVSYMICPDSTPAARGAAARDSGRAEAPAAQARPVAGPAYRPGEHVDRRP